MYLNHLLHILTWVVSLSSVTIAALILIGLVINRFRTHTSYVWTPDLVAAAEARSAREGYLHRILVALDIFVNVVFLRGQQDETISTHAWRASNLGHTWGKWVNAWLNLFQDNHGALAASGDLQRAKSRVAQLSKLLGVLL